MNKIFEWPQGLGRVRMRVFVTASGSVQFSCPEGGSNPDSSFNGSIPKEIWAEIVAWIQAANRSDEHKRGIEWADLALALMANDNDMSRTTKRADIDETMARQAARVGTHCIDNMDEFITGPCCSATRIAVMCSAVDFHDWLNRCFNGDLSKEYFED